MSTHILPPYLESGRTSYAYRLALGERTYSYALRWVPQLAAWYLDLRDAQGTALLTGQRVVLGALYGARLRDPRLPPGYLACEDLSGAETEPTLTSLGAQHVLVWVMPDA